MKAPRTGHFVRDCGDLKKDGMFLVALQSKFSSYKPGRPSDLAEVPVGSVGTRRISS